MRKKLTIFLHITKTAGGTLKEAVMSAENLNVLFLYGPEDREAIAKSDLSSVNMIYGHALFGLHEDLGLDDVQYICFMRHPVIRTISHYYHLRNVDKSHVGDKIRESKDINDFFKTMEHWEFSNLMTKIISGIGPSSITPDEMKFDKAKKHIDAYFSFVGFQECFPLSVDMLSDILGIQLNISRDVNLGRYSLEDISHETLEIIKQKNELDMEIYKHAIDKFL